MRAKTSSNRSITSSQICFFLGISMEFCAAQSLLVFSSSSVRLFVDISLISGSFFPPSISISTFGYCCWSSLFSVVTSVFFPTLALTLVPSGVCVTFTEYPVSGKLSNRDSISPKPESPNNSSMMLLRFLRRDTGFPP